MNDEAAGNNYFLIFSQAVLLVRSLSLKGQQTRETNPLSADFVFFKKSSFRAFSDINRLKGFTEA